MSAKHFNAEGLPQLLYLNVKLIQLLHAVLHNLLCMSSKCYSQCAPVTLCSTPQLNVEAVTLCEPMNWEYTIPGSCVRSNLRMYQG